MYAVINIVHGKPTVVYHYYALVRAIPRAVEMVVEQADDGKQLDRETVRKILEKDMQWDRGEWSVWIVKMKN